LRRIEQEGVLEGINPKVAVLMIGGNDLQNGAQAPSVVANIEKIIQYLREKLPHTRIILLGLLPAGGVPEVVVEQGRLINDALVQMHNGDDLHYMDMRAQFGDENEQIYQDLYLVDGIHLTLKGYQVWHETMGPLFRQLLEFK
jgi:lysophospholipase L1-like esterase